MPFAPFDKRLLRRRAPVYAGILITVCLTLACNRIESGSGFWLQRLDYLLYDWRFGLLSDHYDDEADSRVPVIVVDIDESSLAEQGRWPWSRRQLSQLLTRLADAGVAVVGLDIVLSEAEQQPLGRWLDTVPEQQRLMLLELMKSAPDPDTILASTMRRLDVVAGFFFSDNSTDTRGVLPAPVAQLPSGVPMTFLASPGYNGNLPLFAEASAGAGFVSTFTDSDGSIRRTPLVMRYGDQLYPALSLAMVMTYLLDWQLEPEMVRLGNVMVPRQLAVAGIQVRTDALGRVIVPYKGPARSYRYISAADIMAGRVASDVLEGALVLVGTSAQGLADLRTTPVGTQYPGVEVHANVIDALLNGSFPYRPEWEPGATFLLMILTGLLLSVVLPGMGPLRAIPSSIAALLLVVVINATCWSMGLDLPLAPLILLCFTLVILNLGYGFVYESRSRRTLKGMFDQYVPPAHIEKMLDDPSAYQFQGDNRQMTVLFSDIRSFTSISEGLPANELKQLLSSYFTPVTKTIFDHEGTIDKYVGDMVMAFWGAPLGDVDHASHAVAAALAMIEVTRTLEQPFALRGWPRLVAGIGINTGAMNVGDMGSSYRRAYTVLGDAVNLGSRLESLTKYYGVDVLVGENTRHQALEFEYRFVDRIQVKGKLEALDVFEPLGLISETSAATREELDYHRLAMDLYICANWRAAREAFDELVWRYPQCKLYQVFQERLREWEILPPSDWDGSFQHQQK